MQSWLKVLTPILLHTEGNGFIFFGWLYRQDGLYPIHLQKFILFQLFSVRIMMTATIKGNVLMVFVSANQDGEKHLTAQVTNVNQSCPIRSLG